MAKDDIGGVWRTVGGRRIFIKDGEDLETAMKKSGKFKKSEIKDKNNDKKNKKMTNEEREKKIKELEKKKEETQGFLQKGAIQEEIDMLKDRFDGTKEEYREYIAKEQERRLAEYQKEKEERLKKYKKQNNGEDDYRMTHRPTETGLTADDLLKEGNEVSAPKDIYEHPEYYSSGNKKWNEETIRQLKGARGDENAEITIYRATIGDKINNGDWVTLSKSYAEAHNESQLDGKGKVLEMKVKAKDVQFAGDMLEEWGYFPKDKTQSGSKSSNEYPDWIKKMSANEPERKYKNDLQQLASQKEKETGKRIFSINGEWKVMEKGNANSIKTIKANDTKELAMKIYDIKKTSDPYLKAYNEYKKEHPNSKITFNKFKENIK